LSDKYRVMSGYNRSNNSKGCGMNTMIYMIVSGKCDTMTIATHRYDRFLWYYESCEYVR
jgi:hypothetical protein